MSCKYTFFTNDKCCRTVSRKQLKNIKILLIVSGLIAIALTILEFATLLKFEGVFFTTPLKLIWFMKIIIFNPGLFCIIADHLYYKRLLKAYGISPKSPLWVIDFIEKKAYEIRVLSVKDKDFTFDKTLFKCNIIERGKDFIVTLPGRDIYFSENDAISVMSYIEKANDEVLEAYYPKWKQDADFVSFFKEKQANRINYYFTQSEYESSEYGPCRKPYSILTPIIINEIEYEPFFPNCDLMTNTEKVERIFEDFIEEKEKRKRSAENTQNLINQMNEISVRNFKKNE